jgi:hypothetical protein
MLRHCPPPKQDYGIRVYKSKAAAQSGIRSVQTNAPGATVVDKSG